MKLRWQEPLLTLSKPSKTNSQLIKLPLQLAVEKELAAAYQSKLAAAEMMAEIEEEMARAAALMAFQDKLAADRAAAAAAYATAAYRDALLEAKLAAFEAETRSRTCCSNDG